ncbi:MAG: fasciclin domain-containing protein, partial [Candidatus Thermoplasmatota archaeon]|nr:fasciclin domain-containing protein [Candidatus Thermoplasmatota archaeon]
MYKKHALKKIGSIVVVAALIASAFTMVSLGEGEPVANDTTIAGAAAADGNFSTLVTALQAAGLVETLNGTDKYTVFAPDNDAFNNLPAGVLDNLLNNIDALTSILLYHVVAGEYNATEVLAEDNLTTAQGEKIDINATAGTADGATITGPDYALCSNGIIHKIDAVMIPPSMLVTPPEISNVQATPTAQKSGDAVNITADVMDDLDVSSVKVHITGPGVDVNETMTEGSYYYESTFDTMGTYSYYIWAEDINGNTAKSAIHTF